MTSIAWARTGPTILAAFIASLVEFVEALTVILAIGSIRGWRDALLGTAAALAILLALVVIFGKTLTLLPLQDLQLCVGALLVLFGLRWLRKAVLRSAGLIPLHDEAAAYSRQVAAMRSNGELVRGADRIAFASAFQITMLEGAEVVFIVIAVGSAGENLLLPAGVGAFAALVVVTALGLALRRPLAAIPENTLKFAVGVLLSAFGSFWFGEGAGIVWPGADWSIAGLMAGYLCAGWLAVFLCRMRFSHRSNAPHQGSPL